MKNSRKIHLSLAMLFATLVVFAQDNDTRKLDRFTQISISEGIEVIAEKGSENKVEIEASRIDLDRVLTDVRGGQLSIRIDNKWYRRTPRHNVRIKLTYTEEPDRIKVNTAAEATFRSVLKSRRLDVSATTSGMIELEVDVTTLDLSASTSGRIEIQGDAENLEAGASTGATIYAYDVNAKDVSARANTGADVRITAEDYLSGRAGTGGSISYRGKPRTSVRTNTGGSIRKSN